jgi:ketosteroid isomerase-like protein
MAPDPDIVAALYRLVGAYAAAVDGRDLEALRALFLADATLTVRRGEAEPQVLAGPEGLAAALEAVAAFEHTLHEVSAPVFEVEASGEEANGECVGVAHHVRPAGDDGRTGDDLVLYGRYVDRFRRGEDGTWRFAARELRVLWTEKRPVRLA